MDLHQTTLKTAASRMLLAGILAFGAIGAAAPAVAQTPDVPSYASPAEPTIKGVVRSVDGRYGLTVRDANGYIDHVMLHDGTIINPTGLRLAPGQSVTIVGRPNGDTFTANEIDTPYSSYGYRRYGYPYGPYAYGPYFGIGFHTRGFGFRGFY